eukprot:COSAG01_NODE_6915_length_3441_cov_6.296230_3_plen_492_part_01
MRQRSWTAVLTAWRLVLLPASAGQKVPLNCDTPGELNANFEYVRTVCHQTGEQFPPVDDPFDPIPLTCRDPTCARAVQRVAGDCGALLSQGWFTTRSRKLAAAVAKCALVPQPPSIYPIGTPTMWACGETLTDGDGKYGSDWNKHTVIDAGTGKIAQVTVKTLGLATGDIVQVFDGQACSSLPQRLARLTGGTLPDSPTYTASGRFLCVQLLTDKDGFGTGFTMSVGCVCKDSSTWKDAVGRPCSLYARTSQDSAFDACEGSAGKPVAQGRTPNGLVLTAKEACPQACEACVVDPCTKWPCHNGGVCLQPEPSECQTAGQFASLSEDVTAACCNEASEHCKGGAPSDCNADCARILLPMHHICSQGILQSKGFEATKKTMDAAVALCSSGKHRRRVQMHLAPPTCSCAQGWAGDHCQTQIQDPCYAINCGAHGSCRDGQCQCTESDGWSGRRCETPPCKDGCPAVKSGLACGAAVCEYAWTGIGGTTVKSLT